MRVLALAFPGGSRVIPGLCQNLKDVLGASGTASVVFAPNADGLPALRAYRFALPRADGRSRAIRVAAWVLRYPLCQGEMAFRVWQFRRQVDAVVFFLGCHFLVPALLARALGVPILYVPGGDPSKRVPGLRPLHGAVVRLATRVALESEAELATVRGGARFVSGALRGYRPRDTVAAPSQRPWVLFLSRLEPHKGLEDFLEAAESTPGPVRFVVAGDGRLARAVAAAAQRNPRVGFAGWVSASERWRLLEEARLLVLPSRGGEGVPTVVVEAFHCGTPVLVTDVGGVRDIVVDGETGFVLPPREPLGPAIRAILERRELDEIGRRCRRVARSRLSLESAGGRYRRLLREVVRAANPGRIRR